MTPDDLASASFPHPVRGVAVRETHISLVVLTGDFAYKIKKALRLDFIDASSLERRRELCEEELRLNRRYAAELYLDVVPVTREAGGLRFGGRGEAIEYAVRMRQFDAGEELQALLDANAVDASEIADLAERLADFHAEAAVASAVSGFPRTEAFLRIARANLASIMQRAASIDADTLASHLNQWTERELAHRSRLYTPESLSRTHRRLRRRRSGALLSCPSCARARQGRPDCG